MAMVTSTMPRFGPQCPPCLLNFSTSRVRISPAISFISSMDSLLTSAGDLMCSIIICFSICVRFGFRMQNYKEIRQLTITCSLEKTTHVPGDARTDVRFCRETPGRRICLGIPSLPSPSPEYAQASRQTGSATFLTLCSKTEPSAYFLIFTSTLRMRQNPPRRH